MNQSATKDDLKQAVREIISHFNESQGTQTQWIKEEFGQVNTKLNDIAEDVEKVKLAVVDLLATDRHLHNLVKALQKKGIELNEAEIFAS